MRFFDLKTLAMSDIGSVVRTEHGIWLEKTDKNTWSLKGSPYNNTYSVKQLTNITHLISAGIVGRCVPR